MFGFLLFFGIGPGVIAGALLAITYRKDIRRDPAATVAALLTGCATLYLAALPLIFGGYAFFSEGLIHAWRLFIFCVGALFFINQKFFPVISRIYDAIHRVLRPLFPAEIPRVLNEEPPPPKIIRPPLAKDVRPPPPSVPKTGR